MNQKRVFVVDDEKCIADTLATILRRYGSQVFKNAQRHELIPAASEQGLFRPAAVKAGGIPGNYKGRFGWHNLDILLLVLRR